MSDAPYINGLPITNMSYVAPRPGEVFDFLNSRSPGVRRSIGTTHELDSTTPVDVAKVIYAGCAPSRIDVERALRGTGLTAMLIKPDDSDGYNIVLMRGRTENVSRGDRFFAAYQGSDTPIAGTVQWTVEAFANGEPYNILGLIPAFFSTPITQATGVSDTLVAKGQAAVENLKTKLAPYGATCGLPAPVNSPRTGVGVPGRNP